jgi:hypothetical protein
LIERLQKNALKDVTLRRLPSKIAYEKINQKNQLTFFLLKRYIKN